MSAKIGATVEGSIVKCFRAMFFAAALFSAPPLSAGDQPVSGSPKIAEYKDIQLLADTLSVLQFLAMDNRDSRNFVYPAIEAMTGSLDRYSFFVPPDLTGLFTYALKDRYIGTGVHLARNGNGRIEVISTEPGSPAAIAGIRPKDIIVSIDGRPVNSMQFTESLKMISGPGFSVGSSIQLSISRNDGADSASYILKRDFIKQETITWKIPERGYGYIRISKFNMGALADFRKAVNDMAALEGMLKGLVIDLRNNPGGDMDACIEILRLFLASCDITSLDSNLPQFKVKFRAYDQEVFSWPLIVLVNGGSASASELFSGVLQFHGRAAIIGSKTFGKGSFQSLVPLAGGGGLYVTLGKFHLPDGRTIEGSGVTPDVLVEDDVNESRLIQRSLEILKSNS